MMAKDYMIANTITGLSILPLNSYTRVHYEALFIGSLEECKKKYNEMLVS